MSRFINLIGQRADDKATSFCLMDTEKKDKDGNLELSNWAKNQFVVDGDKITVKSLVAWGDVAAVVATQDGGASIKGKSWLDNNDPDVKVDLWKDRIQIGTLPADPNTPGGQDTNPPMTPGKGSSGSSASSIVISSLVAAVVVVVLAIVA